MKVDIASGLPAFNVARTIVDLAGSDSLKADHVAEAVQYRRCAAEN